MKNYYKSNNNNIIKLKYTNLFIKDIKNLYIYKLEI